MIARWFWREWRSPSLLIVWLALSLAVACVLALGNISDRMEKGLSQQSREFMAGDRSLQSSRTVPKAWIDEARQRGLKVGRTADLCHYDLCPGYAAVGERQSGG